MKQWRNSCFSFLALFSLLAMALPPFVWVCFARNCAGPLPRSIQFTVRHCDSLECGIPHPKCCEPFQLPINNNNSPATPSKPQTSIFGLLRQPNTITPAGNFYAALPTAPAVIEPHHERSLEIGSFAASFLLHSKAPPLAGRSPPAA